MSEEPGRAYDVRPIGQVVVRRQVLSRPQGRVYGGAWGREANPGSPFRYPWAEEQAALLAWEWFETAGWSWMQMADDEGLGFPPLYLLGIRATPDPRYFIASFSLRGDAYLAEDGFLMAAGYIG